MRIGASRYATVPTDSLVVSLLIASFISNYISTTLVEAHPLDRTSGGAQMQKKVFRVAQMFQAPDGNRW